MPPEGEPAATPTATPEPAPAPAPEPQAPAAPPEGSPAPAEPPNLSDAVAQMQESVARIESRLPEQPQAPAPDPWSRFAGLDDLEDDYYEEPAPAPQQQAPQQQQPAPSEQEQFAQQVQGWIQQAVQQTVTPVFQQQEMQRREQAIHALADEFPRLREAEVLDAVEREVDAIASRYAQGDAALFQLMRTDPDIVRRTYLAHEAQQASQGEGAPSQEDTAEAVGQQGVTLETGAGPGAPPPEVDPLEKALADAITGGQAKNAFTG